MNSKVHALSFLLDLALGRIQRGIGTASQEQLKTDVEVAANLAHRIYELTDGSLDHRRDILELAAVVLEDA